MKSRLKIIYSLKSMVVTMDAEKEKPKIDKINSTITIISKEIRAFRVSHTENINRQILGRINLYSKEFLILKSC